MTYAHAERNLATVRQLAAETRQAAVPAELGKLRAELSSVIDGLTSVLDEVREIAHGSYPSILAESGLGPALKTLAHRSPIPVQLDVEADAPLPQPIELAAYCIVSEALANTANNAQASVVRVAVEARDRVLRVTVREDGIGGAISLRSPRAAGTSSRVELPPSLGEREPVPESLSNSEKRILRYLPTHLSAPEIAGELYLSVHTVKSHMRHLYAKLGTHQRAETVERARALGLLPPSSRQRIGAPAQEFLR
jgi:DNA-binding CsgD family transcriptional regulator